MDIEKNSFTFSKNKFIQNCHQIKGPQAKYFYHGVEKLQPLSQWMNQSRQSLKKQIEKKKTQPLLLKPASAAPAASFEKLLENSKSFVFWIQENQKQDFQIDYKDYKNLKTPFLIENFIILEKKSHLNLFEVAEMQPPSPLWIVNYIYINSKAHCRRMHIHQNCSAVSSYTFCSLYKDSCFFDLELNTGSSSSIHLEITGIEPGSLSVVQGLNILKKQQQSRQKIINIHKAEGGISRQFYRSVLGGRSKNTLHSKAVIQAQNTDSHQMIQNLILGPHARAENKPELEVKKDCVKAAHGASTGQLNPLEIFYLNSRGVPTDKAVQFLVKGWISQVFQIQNEKDLGSKAKPISDFVKNINLKIKSKFLDHKIHQLLSDPQNCSLND